MMYTVPINRGRHALLRRLVWAIQRIIKPLTAKCLAIFGSQALSGWWFGTFLAFSHILGMSSSQLTNSYFSEGCWNHQPVFDLWQIMKPTGKHFEVDGSGIKRTIWRLQHFGGCLCGSESCFLCGGGKPKQSQTNSYHLGMVSHTIVERLGMVSYEFLWYLLIRIIAPNPDSDSLDY